MNKAKTYTIQEYVSIAKEGGKFENDRLLATFGNRDNWEQINDEKGCRWCWKGFVLPPFEMADNAHSVQEAKAEMIAKIEGMKYTYPEKDSGWTTRNGKAKLDTVSYNAALEDLIASLKQEESK